MSSNIKRVAVLGSGVMGGGIAAQVANAGFPVVLLDIVPDGAVNRNQVAESAVQRLHKTGGFMHPDNANLITTGNLEDDLELLADCDWIVEAVIEQLDIKHDLYRRVDAVRKTGSVVSSNTSTIPLRLLVEGQSEAFARDFLITHFFNPPRHMRLLELVGSEKTRPEALAQIRKFADVQLGKGIVACKDTAGFIANRIGIYWMQCGLLSAFELGVTVEQADAVMSRPVGIPKTGIFGLWDLIGIDLGPHLIRSMTSTLEPTDRFHPLAKTPQLVSEMIAEGYTGRKGRGGFYRMNKSNGKKRMESKDLLSGDYHPVAKPELESLASAKSGLRSLVSHPDRGGRYAWEVLSSTLCYAASLVPEICDRIDGVDEAMRLGYAWKYGPFELIDQLGAAWFVERLRTEGREVPAILEKLGNGSFYRIENGVRQQFSVDGQYRDIERPEGVLLLADIKLRNRPLAQNSAATLWDIGDGAACLEFHTKMNAMEPAILQMIDESIDIVGSRFKALVLYNEGPAFCAGANLSLIRQAILDQEWRELSGLIETGQQAYRKIQSAPFPVVGAPSGMALGGGCEILLHSDAIQAHAETYAGLVEIGVGLVPAWGGCKEMLKRWNARTDSESAALKAFELIATAKVSGSAVEARGMGLLREDDRITMNRDRLLDDAKTRALALAVDYHPQPEGGIPLAGAGAKGEMLKQLEAFAAAGKAAPHDLVVGAALADILTGHEAGECSEDDLYIRELGAFSALLRTADTLSRIEHMLNTGKPLRN
ncbi:MAG: 3-hydroxyacyl-CoA dehydrogenase/enoyl-CoA hydratase family protein [Candidatus Thiodiazotropha sp.]